MKSNKINGTICLLSCFFLNACGNDKASGSIEQTSQNDDSRIHGEYVLEKDEVYTKAEISYVPLNDYSAVESTSIDGTSFLIDPFYTGYFYGKATVRYPDAAFLANHNIIYSSAWYNQKTFKREDSCKEYVLELVNNVWSVADIKDSSETFIPFNGLVLSVSADSPFELEIGDEVTINYNFEKYLIGFYNQDGNRVVISNANSSKWTNNGVNLYDDNSLSYVTSSRYSNLALINFLYDEKKNEYYIDNFRLRQEQGKAYNNVNGGVALAGALNTNNNNLALLEGVRFNLNDSIKVEDNSTLYEQKYNLVLNSKNTITYIDNSKVDFSISKTNMPYTVSPWKLEVAIDKNGMIVDYGYQVAVPSGGYKLVISGEEDTNSEKLSYLCETVFAKTNNVSIKGTAITIENNLFEKYFNLYSLTKSYCNEAISSVENDNYSYDINTINKVNDSLKELGPKMDALSDSENSTDTFRLYNLTGKIYQLYYSLLSATNRNEAAMIKSCWYIIDYSKYDNDLKSMQYNLDRIKNSGINEIIVYVFDNGAVCYNNSDMYDPISASVNKDYGKYGNDLLKALIGEAHARNMTVQACFCPFTSNIERKYSELRDAMALSVKGKCSVMTSQGTVSMLDPANELVQTKIKETVRDIISSNPGLDGIHLDYIRYGADSDAYNTVMGVTEAARVGFNEFCANNDYALNFQSLEQLQNALSNSSTLSIFNLYEQRLITDTVANVKDVCKDFDLPLTCAIADYYERVVTWKCQNWKDWTNERLVDGLYLMDYFFDDYWIDYYFKDMLSHTDNNAFYVTGISTSYANLFDEFYSLTIKGAVTNPYSQGYATFGSHTQNAKKDGWDLISGSNWLNTVSCYDSLSKTLKATGDLLLSRCDDIYIKYNNQTNEQKELLASDLDKLYQAVSTDSYESATSAITLINEMLDKTYASNSADERIIEQLNYMLKLATVKQNIYRD